MLYVHSHLRFYFLLGGGSFPQLSLVLKKKKVISVGRLQPIRPDSRCLLVTGTPHGKL